MVTHRRNSGWRAYAIEAGWWGPAGGWKLPRFDPQPGGLRSSAGAIAGAVSGYQVALDATASGEGQEVVRGERVSGSRRAPAPGAVVGRGEHQLAGPLVRGAVAAPGWRAATALALLGVLEAAGLAGQGLAVGLETWAEGHPNHRSELKSAWEGWGRTRVPRAHERVATGCSGVLYRVEQCIQDGLAIGAIHRQ